MRNPQFLILFFVSVIIACSETEGIKLNLVLPNAYEGPVLLLFSANGQSIGFGDTVYVDQDGLSPATYRFVKSSEKTNPPFREYQYFYGTPGGILPVELREGARSVHVANGITGTGIVVDQDTIMRHAEYLISLLFNTQVSRSWKVIPQGTEFDQIISGNQWKLKYWTEDEAELYRPTNFSGSRMREEIDHTSDFQRWTLLDQYNLIDRPLPQPGSTNFGKTNGYLLLVCHEDKRIGCDEYISIVEE